MLPIIEYFKDLIEGKALKGQRRSSGWRAFRREQIAKHPYCAVCKRSGRLQLHHRVPFHIAPQLELDPDNVIVLCTRGKVLNCHLIFGHLGDFRRINPSVDSDIAQWATKLNRV